MAGTGELNAGLSHRQPALSGQTRVPTPILSGVDTSVLLPENPVGAYQSLCQARARQSWTQGFVWELGGYSVPRVGPCQQGKG